LPDVDGVAGRNLVAVSGYTPCDQTRGSCEIALDLEDFRIALKDPIAHLPPNRAKISRFGGMRFPGRTLNVSKTPQVVIETGYGFETSFETENGLDPVPSCQAAALPQKQVFLVAVFIYRDSTYCNCASSPAV
jgi:hypothetical protein